MFPLEISRLEVLNFYLNGRYTGESGDRDGSGSWALEARGNSIKMFNRNRAAVGKGT